MYMKRACITDAADADSHSATRGAPAPHTGAAEEEEGHAEKEGFGIVLLSFLFE
jgi:hypothetical protein